MTTQNQVNNSYCVHHWMIETPHGAASVGRCKKCQAARFFNNGPDQRERAFVERYQRMSQGQQETEEGRLVTELRRLTAIGNSV